MSFRNLKIAGLALLLLACMAIVQACGFRSALVGTWISESPADLRFEIRSNGSVWLLTANLPRQIWRYELSGNNTLTLYDGIGRKRIFRFAIQGNNLTFSDPTTGKTVEKYSRWNP